MIHDTIVSAFLERCSSLDRRIVVWALEMRFADEEMATRLSRPLQMIQRRRERLMGELHALIVSS
jgi:hypothetical protein